jgi:hypothetical protein
MEHTISTDNIASHVDHTILTASSQQLNEIMPMIYKRFTEKSAEEWRQIYKVSKIQIGAYMVLIGQRHYNC